jgi:GGDEF domain-containing protein
MEAKARKDSGNGIAIKEYRVDRAAVPAAGFEDNRAKVEVNPTGFLNTIGAARQEAQLLFEIAQGLVTSLSISEMMDHLTQRFHTLVKFDAAAVYLRRGGLLETVYACGDDAPLFRTLRIPVGQGISGWVAESGKTIRNGNPSVEPGYLNSSEVFTIHRSALAVPLEGSSGILGTLTLYSRQGDAFTPDDLRILVAIASKLGLSIENGMRVIEAEDCATTDFLTGLPNARALFARLRAEVEKASSEGGTFVVLLADLDGFKKVNDCYGHMAGNNLLREVARVLLHECREMDMVARMGGDEFVIVCPNMPAPAAVNLAGRLRRALEVILFT